VLESTGITCFVCGSRSTQEPATKNANMDFRFWREDASREQQKGRQIGHCHGPSRHHSPVLYGREPPGHFSDADDGEKTMEDHTNEVMTDQAFVAVVKRRTFTAATTIAIQQSVRLVQARCAIQAYYNTAPEPRDINNHPVG
jgi:hypothetical protein